MSFVVSGAGHCFAVGSLFLPGDACFPSSISDEILNPHEGGLKLTFGGWTNRSGGMDGYCGWKSINIVDEQNELIKRLQDAYRTIRKSHGRKVEFEAEEDGSQSLLELNKVCIYIHNADFRFTQYSPFFGFNEKWVQEANEWQQKNVAGGHSKPRRQNSFPDFDNTEWRDAEKVPPLKHQTRKRPDRDDEIECKSSDIKVLMMAQEDVETLFQSAIGNPVDVSSVTMLCIERTGISRYEFSRRKWKLADETGNSDVDPD